MACRREAFEGSFGLQFERCVRLRKQHALAYRAVGPPPPAQPANPLPPLPIARDSRPAKALCPPDRRGQQGGGGGVMRR